MTYQLHRQAKTWLSPNAGPGGTKFEGEGADWAKRPWVGMVGCQEVLGRAGKLEPSQLPGPGLGRGSVGEEDKFLSWWDSQGGAIGPEVGTVPLRATHMVGVLPLTPS